MKDGFQAIVDYVNQFPNYMMYFEGFLFDYIWKYWFETMKPIFYYSLVINLSYLHNVIITIYIIVCHRLCPVNSYCRLF